MANLNFPPSSGKESSAKKRRMQRERRIENIEVACLPKKYFTFAQKS